MDSSAHDDAMEPPIRDSEPDEDRIEPTDAPMDLADEEGFPLKAREARTDVPDDELPTEDPLMQPGNQLPVELAEPGMYYCDAEDPGIHPQLGRLVEGENDFTGVTHPEELMAIARLVQDGVLRKA